MRTIVSEPLHRVKSANVQKGNASDLAFTPQLQQTVDLQASRLPLETVLQRISNGRDVHLQVTEPSIRFQRVTIDVTAMKLSDLMNDIIAVLSHGESNPKHPQYFWRPLKTTSASKNSKPLAYELRVTYAAKDSLLRELDRPRRDALQFLKDMRDEYNLPAEKRLQHPHIMQDDFFRTIDRNTSAVAVSDLSDDDLTRLTDGQHIFIHSEAMNAALQKESEGSIAAARAHGDQREYSPYQPSPAAEFTVAISDSFYIDNPLHDQTFMINVYPGKFTDYVSGGTHIGGDDYDFVYGVGLLPKDSKPSPPVYDLAPVFDASTVTTDQRLDVGFNLAAIAKVAHINVIAEQFLRAPASMNGLHRTKGTLSELVNDLCVVWNLRVTKIGNDYLFWDRGWGRMRQADVSDAELNALRKRIDKQGGDLSDLDRINLCGRYSYLQLALTIPYAIPEVGKIGSYRGYLSKRIVSAMTPEERSEALQPSGAAFGQLSPAAQEVLRNDLDYHRFLGQYNPALAPAFNETLLMGSSIHLRPDESRNHELDFQPESLSVVLGNGEDLWRVSVVR